MSGFEPDANVQTRLIGLFIGERDVDVAKSAVMFGL
jgi:hypothetical protein